MTINWKPFVDLVAANESFVLTSHMRPDCDALGSELALAAALESLGKRVRIVNADGVPPHIGFIDLHHKVEVWGEDAPLDRFATPDVHIVLDTSAWQQLGPIADVLRATTAKKVVIDHHISTDDMGAMLFKDTRSESTGRLVLEAIEALGAKLTPEIAKALFAAIATDTGWFRFNSVAEDTFQAAAKLVAAGARPAELFSLLYEQHSLARLHLHGLVLRHIQLQSGGRLAYSQVTLRDLAETCAETTDTEDVVNRLLTIAGVKVAALFVELEPTWIKVSLRSRGNVDVRAVAETFGGGGHTAAAGIRYQGTLAEAQSTILDAVRKAMG
jgi:phosphoesterase RecJ-like protein